MVVRAWPPRYWPPRYWPPGPGIGPPGIAASLILKKSVFNNKAGQRIGPALCLLGACYNVRPLVRQSVFGRHPSWQKSPSHRSIGRSRSVQLSTPPLSGHRNSAGADQLRGGWSGASLRGGQRSAPSQPEYPCPNQCIERQMKQKPDDEPHAAPSFSRLCVAASPNCRRSPIV